MTADDEKKIEKANRLIKEVFPNMCGNVRFNLHPERVKVNVNVEYSVWIEPKDELTS